MAAWILQFILVRIPTQTLPLEPIAHLGKFWFFLAAAAIPLYVWSLVWFPRSRRGR
jgi:hypothetical protein